MSSDLLKKLNSRDTMEIIITRQALVEKGPAVVPALIELLETGEDKPVSNAVLVLAEIADERAVPALLDCFAKRKNLILRSNIAKALGNFRHPSVLPAIHAALASEDEILAVWLLDSLGRIGNISSVPILLDYLPSVESPSLRVVVIRTLGKFMTTEESETIKAQLLPYANDPDHHVRRELSNLFGELDQRETLRSNDS